MARGEIRKDLLCALTVCLLAITNWIGRLSGPIDLRWDAGVYYTLGTSLYEGKGYRLLNEPGEIRGNQYPPLLPAIVAIHQTITGSSDPFVAGRLMRWSWMVLYVVYIPSVFWLARRYVGRHLAVGAALITLLNPQSTFLSEAGFAELPFAAVSVAFFLFYRKRGAVGSGIAFLSAAACYLLRTIGITLLATWVMDAVWQRRFRAAAARGVLAAVPVLAWQTYVSSIETSPEYRQPQYAFQRASYMFYNVSYAENVSLQDPFLPWNGRITPVGLVVRTLRDLRPLTYGLGEAVTSSNVYWHRLFDRIAWLPERLPGVIIRCCQVLLALLILLGLTRMLYVNPAMALYLALSLLAIAAAPWPGQYIRYLSPVTPFLAIALALGLLAISRLIPAGRAAYLAQIMFGLILVQQSMSLFLCYRHDHREVTEVTGNGTPARYRLFYYGDGYRSLDAAVDWIAKQSRTTDIIAAGMPHWFSLRTGRKAIMVPFGAGPSTAARLMADVPVRYVVLDTIEPVSITSFVERGIEHSPEWRQVFTSGKHCRVFERIGP